LYPPASTKVRAADSVLNQWAKAIEIEDIEVRVAELEASATASSSIAGQHGGLQAEPRECDVQTMPCSDGTLLELVEVNKHNEGPDDLTDEELDKFVQSFSVKRTRRGGVEPRTVKPRTSGSAGVKKRQPQGWTADPPPVAQARPRNLNLPILTRIP
jgi:hypothetical protein